jgi:hypothetical protein
LSLDEIIFEKIESARQLFLIEEKSLALSTLKESKLNVKHIEKELKNQPGNMDYLDSYANSSKNSIIGLFSCSYHPYLSLEYSSISEVDPTIQIPLRFENIRCVRQDKSTVGIMNEQVVAIFPENFKNVKAQEKHPVFFFVNKFTSRHLKHTRPFLQKSQHKNLFLPILSLPVERLEGLISNWVNLHEASHRQGPMPLPEFLFEKSHPYTAGLEELRADVWTINTLLENSNSIESEEYLTAVYVFAERLYSYPLFRHKLNFDTISSILFWKILNDHGFFKNLCIKETIRFTKDFIEKIELISSHESSKINRKQKLKYLIEDYIGNYDEQFNNYRIFWGNI